VAFPTFSCKLPVGLPGVVPGGDVGFLTHPVQVFVQAVEKEIHKFLGGEGRREGGREG